MSHEHSDSEDESHKALSRDVDPGDPVSPGPDVEAAEQSHEPDPQDHLTDAARQYYRQYMSSPLPLKLTDRVFLTKDQVRAEAQASLTHAATHQMFFAVTQRDCVG
jgi:hypothetical protein